MAVCSVLFLAAFATHPAFGQAVPAATWPAGNSAPDQQPLASQQLGSNLTLNQGVSALAAENEIFQHLGFGLEALGGAETNFFGTQTDQETVSFAQFTGQIGLRIKNPRTEYFALYEPGYHLYPAYSDVSNFSQSFFQNLTHEFTQRSGIAWGVTAARYLSLNQFLPQNFSVGGIGIVAPVNGAFLRENSFEITNVGTQIIYRYLMGPRLTFTGSLTSGLFIDLPADVSGTVRFSQRSVPSGADLRLDYQWTPRDTIGGELTPIYIYGIDPPGHVLAEAVQISYRRQLTPNLSARAAAGPLFVQGSSPTFGSINDTSYALSASVSRQIRQSQFSVGFNRAFVVDFLSPSLVSNSLSGTAYLPIRRHWIFTGTANYTRDSGQGAYGSEAFYGGTAQLAYQVGARLQLFARYSVQAQDFNQQANLTAYNFVRNQFGGGIRLTLGSATPTGGMQ
jgi:hypothetical protein